MSEEGIQAGRAIRRWHNDHIKAEKSDANCPHCNPATHWFLEQQMASDYTASKEQCDHETVIASTSFPEWEGHQCIKCGELFNE